MCSSFRLTVCCCCGSRYLICTMNERRIGGSIKLTSLSRFADADICWHWYWQLWHLTYHLIICAHFLECTKTIFVVIKKIRRELSFIDKIVFLSPHILIYDLTAALVQIHGVFVSFAYPNLFLCIPDLNSCFIIISYRRKTGIHIVQIHHMKSC